MEKYYISLSKYEEINIAGGLKNVWELPVGGINLVHT